MPEDFHQLYKDPYDGRLYVANPSSTLNQWVTGPFEPDATARPASRHDVMNALNQTDVEFLDLLKVAGYTDLEVAKVGEAWNCSKEAIAKYQQAEDAGKIDHAENFYLTELAAVMVEEIARAHGAVNTPAIQQATLSDLRNAEESYDGMLRGKFAELLKLQETIQNGDYTTNAEWCKAYALFHKWAGYLWQVRTRLNINVFSGEIVRETPQT